MHPQIAKWFEALPPLADAPLGQPLVELVGTNRLVVENHRGITQYSPCCIGIAVKYGTILVEGEALSVACMSRAQLQIVGKVRTITLKRREAP